MKQFDKSLSSCKSLFCVLVQSSSQYYSFTHFINWSVFVGYSCTSRFIPRCAAENLIKSMTAVDDTAFNEMFHGQEDRFNGITVDSSKEKSDISDFPKKLEGNVLCRCICFSEPYILFRVALSTEFTVIIPG